jgi:glyceraldehyde 3-phosphate dehydrogenase
MNTMKKIAGINGFGRFGLHLLKYWLDRSSDSKFIIKYINDNFLSIDQAINIIKADNAVIFNKYKIKKLNNTIRILEPNGHTHEIQYSNDDKSEIPWIGEPDIFFECSGKNTVREDCAEFLTSNTKLVMISATSWDADETLVYGFNHELFNKDFEIISYGSCTVNAYTPLAAYINDKYGLIDSDVNVIHNIQQYRMSDNYTLNRKFCTLEKSAEHLLDCINANNFVVNYTVIPYTGVSMIDFRFRLENCPSKELFINDIEKSISEGNLYGLYDIHDSDLGPEVHNCTTFSSIFVRDNIKIINDQVYLFSYFDNENSVNRFFDLANYISKI